MRVNLETGPGWAKLIFHSENGMNLLNAATIHELNLMSQELRQNPGLRVVSIRSEGNVFGAGGDLTCFVSNDKDTQQRIVAAVSELNQAILNLYQLPALVICAVHGVVAGGSIGLMNVADFVVAAKGTRFNTAYCKIAASPDVGSSWFLPQLLGYRKAMELLIMGENFDADAAREMGLVNWVVPREQLNDVAEKLVNRLLHGPQQSFRHIKRLCSLANRQDLSAQLQAEQQALSEIVQDANFSEGVRAFLENRSPHFHND